MAARRLIIVLVVLFVASVIAAAIAPERQSLVGDESDTTSTTSTTTATETTTTDADPSDDEDEPSSPSADPDRVNVRLTASPTDPPTGEAVVGDQVELIVASDRFLQLEIPAFGVTGNASPNAPARFSLLLREAGELPILAARDGKTVARLVVTSTRRHPPSAP